MPTLLWFHSGSCSGESMAILGAEEVGQSGQDLLTFVEDMQVQLLWHPSLSPEGRRYFSQLLDAIIAGEQDLTLLCVEGSILHGPNGTGRYDTFEGRAKKDILRPLCDMADYVLAMGTCAAYGGIPASPPNPTEATGLQFSNHVPGGLLPPSWRSRAGLPVINLAGCPVDGASMINTMCALLHGVPLEFDNLQRPHTVGPCLSGGGKRKCGTAERVGYACYGCISAKFPVAKPLFNLASPFKTRPRPPAALPSP
jgi:uptake hydrogenase small subunit